MGRSHKRTAVKPRSGKPRKAITIQINQERNADLLTWLAAEGKKSSVQAVIMNALHLKMTTELGEDSLEDTKPMSVPEMEADPSLLQQLYESLVQVMAEQAERQNKDAQARQREMLAMLRDIRNSTSSNTSHQNGTALELKPELKSAMISSMKPGKSVR